MDKLLGETSFIAQGTPEWVGATRLRRVRGAKSRNITFLILPSISGVWGRSAEFYKRLQQRLAQRGDVITCEYPGLGDRGLFSVNEAAYDLNQLLSSLGSRGIEVRVFGACTGFLVALQALLQCPRVQVGRVFGWHVPRRMHFSTDRLQRFNRLYGLRYSPDSVSDHIVSDLLEQVRAKWDRTVLIITRGRDSLEDDSSIDYLRFPFDVPIDDLRCEGHVPDPRLSAFAALLDRTEAELSD